MFINSFKCNHKGPKKTSFSMCYIHQLINTKRYISSTQVNIKKSQTGLTLPKSTTM